MNLIRNKLREKSGASIFMGLMFLLVVLFVGAVVLTASTAAAGKLAEQREREQDYLNVASAARLVKGRICKLTYTNELECKKDASGNMLSESSSQEFKTSDGSTSNKVILENELKELCGSLVEDPEAEPAPAAPLSALPAEKPFKIELSSASGSTGVDWETVYGSLRVEADGRIIVELWLGNENKEHKDSHNHMEIEFCPDGPVKRTEVTSTEDAGVITETSTTTTTYSWPESGCTITKGKQ